MQIFDGFDSFERPAIALDRHFSKHRIVLSNRVFVNHSRTSDDVLALIARKDLLGRILSVSQIIFLGHYQLTVVILHTKFVGTMLLLTWFGELALGVELLQDLFPSIQEGFATHALVVFGCPTGIFYS